MGEWADKGLIPRYFTHDKRLDGINTALCRPVRPDFFWDQGSWVLVLENDEHEHNLNEPRCEHLRTQDIINAFGQVPVYMIRFNPHAFKVHGNLRKISTHNRMDMLLKIIQTTFENPVFQYHLSIHYVFYSCQCAQACLEIEHMDRFTTAMEYAKYIDVNYPLALMGTGQQVGPGL